MANENMPCTKCGTTMHLVTRERRIPVAGLDFAVTMPTYECPNDESWIIPGDVHRAMDRQVLKTIATHGPVNGQTLRYLRGALRLKATELAPLVETRPETLSRWENGAAPVNSLVWVSVAAMVLDKLANRSTTLRQLESAKDPTPPKPVAIHVQGAA